MARRRPSTLVARHWARTVCVLVLAGILMLDRLADSATAIIFFGTDDPTFNTTAPTGTLADSGWQWQGNWGNFLGTAVAPNYFLAAKHVGGNVGDTFNLNGVDYTAVAAVANVNSDLRLWKIGGTFDSFAPLYTASNETGKNIVVFGRGTRRGAEVRDAATSTLKGWQWGTADNARRWGENAVAGNVSGGAGIGSLLNAKFNANGGVNEGHLSVGDSSGGVFINDAGIWKLAGINYAVDGPYNTTDTGGGFNAAIFDEGGLYKKDINNNWLPINDGANDVPGGFYATRIFSNVRWINSIITRWKVDADGSWNTASNWSGGVPNGIDRTATFTNSITAPRVVTLNVAVMLGTLDFFNDNAYTLAGANALTLDVSSGSAVVNQFVGSHTIAAPLQTNDDTNWVTQTGNLLLSGPLGNPTGRAWTKSGPGALTIRGVQTHGAGAVLNANAGTVHLDSDGGANLTVNANAPVVVGASQHLAALHVADGVTVTLTPGGGEVLSLGAYTLGPTGGIDLADNDLVIRADGGSRAAVLADVTARLTSGAAALAWNGPGISSSTAATDSAHLTALGVILNDDGLGGPLYSNFSGEPVDLNSVLVKYTYYGDADLSGIVDGTDYALIDNGFNAGLLGWLNGDFDYSGTIDGTDYALIDNAFNAQGGALGHSPLAAVPEPSALALLGAGMLVGAYRLRTRNRQRAIAPRG